MIDEVQVKKLITYRGILAAVFLLLINGIALGQAPQLNEEKYWEYRDRLRNEFMIGIGPGMGMSTPAGVRDTVSGILQWTDATMDLGQYIGVLAMEYRILENKGMGTDETVEELFYALYALNRLDYNAERFFGGTRSLNGFFIRDDIDEDSLNMPAVLEHLNQGLAEPKITGLDSDHMDEIPRNNEESLDQAILLITGLGMVERCVPENVVYTENKNVMQFQDFETSLQVEAGNIITRIVNYMKEGDSTIVTLNPDDPNLYGIGGDAWDFIIKNPVSYEPVLRGENAFLLSKGFTSSKYHFTGLESLTTDLSIDTVADTIFKSFEMYIVPNDQDFKVINLNAMSNYWPEGLQTDTTNTGYNAKILGPRAQVQAYEWIPMLHQLVFGGENNYLMSEVPPDTLYYNDPGGYYAYLINTAPGTGPYNYGDSIWPSWEWSSTSRTIQPGRRGETGNAFPGNYNGLDYMIYYNMYTLLFPPGVSTGEKAPANVRIYPNPFSNTLHIALEHTAAYEIFSGNGLLIKSGTLNTTGGQTGRRAARLNMKDIRPGMYIIRITDEYNNVHSKKIIKQQY